MVPPKPQSEPNNATHNHAGKRVVVVTFILRTPNNIEVEVAEHYQLTSTSETHSQPQHHATVMMKTLSP